MLFMNMEADIDIVDLVLILWFCSEEDRKWFMEAMQAQTIDVVKRMKEITLVMQTPEQVLKDQGVTPADIEGILHLPMRKTN